MIIDFSIPETVRKAIFDLNYDKEFDKIYNEDKDLNELFDRTTDYIAEEQLLQLNCCGKVNIAGVECNGYSPLAINLLWLLHSPVLYDITKVQYDDVAVAAWLLFNDNIDLQNVMKLKETAKSFFEKIGLDKDVALSLIMKNLQLAFYPLRYILTNNENKLTPHPVFDQLWMTNLTSIVSKCISDKSETIQRMPLATCYLYYVNYLRQQGCTNVMHFTDDEIKADIELRTCELIVDYFVQKKIINSEDKDKIFASLTKDHQKSFTRVERPKETAEETAEKAEKTTKKRTAKTKKTKKTAEETDENAEKAEKTAEETKK